MEQLDHGAEAIIYHDKNRIIKDRVRKSYRHPILDQQLRKMRTRREAKILSELSKTGFPAPRIHHVDDRTMQINMEFINGKKLRDVFETDFMRFAAEIGKQLAILHQQGIIHADLTTSNMMLHDQESRLYLIDFGLSFFSDKVEDKAVDLHLLRQALESKHPRVHRHAFEEVARAYLAFDSKNQAVIQRLSIVEKRGRYKMKEL